MAKYKKLIVELWNDSDAECPSEWGGWKLYSFSRKHINFKHPDEFFPPNIGLRRKLKTGTAFILSYFEHGNSFWMLKNSPEWDSCPDKQWDGTAVAGMLIYEYNVKELNKTYEARKANAVAFVESYTNWANGNIFGYSIETPDGEDIASCGGYLNSDVMFSDIHFYTKDAEEVEVTGEAKWLADYDDIKPKLPAEPAGTTP